MSTAVKISDVDKGYTARLRAIASMNGTVTSRVGIYGSEAAANHDEKSGLTNGELAAIHEFGAGVPERSFIRAWVDQNEAKIRAELKSEALVVLTGRRDVYTACSRFGRWAESGIRERIAAGIAPANAQATIARKGGATPLVDTTVMVSAIDSAVERNRRVLR